MYTVRDFCKTEEEGVKALEKLAAFEDAGGSVFFYNAVPTHALTPDLEDEIAGIMEGFENEAIYSANALMKKVRS